jgi:hypothetical protein
VSSRRQSVTIEFDPPAYDRVATSLAQLVAEGNGWINLLPGVDEEAAAIQQPQAGLFAFFGNRQAPVTMATIMPARLDKKASDGMQVGLMHPTGAKAVDRLAEAGVAMPEGWTVRQDHVRRGLVLRTKVGEEGTVVIDWCVRAGTALCRVDMTGSWQAVVYLP